MQLPKRAKAKIASIIVINLITLTLLVGHFTPAAKQFLKDAKSLKEAALKELEILKSKKKSAWYLYYPMD